MLEIFKKASLAKFSKNLVLIKVRRRVEEICDGLGPEWVEKGITRKIPFKLLMPIGLKVFLTAQVEKGRLEPEQAVDPDALEAFMRSGARSVAWAAQAVTDDDIRAMIPPWAMSVIEQHGPDGKAWLEGLLGYVHSYFVGE